MIVKALTDLQPISIRDELGRSFRTLRISLTNQCNLACTYCVPENHKGNTSPLKKLSTDEYIEVVKRISQLTSIETVRLTGGEPLLYKEILKLIEGLREAGIENIKLTTNGVFLSGMANDLRESGLSSMNVSLDGLTEETFSRVSRRKDVASVLSGIEAAVKAGIQVKINTVIMKGINDQEIVPLFEYAGRLGVPIRYLELMQMGHMSDQHRDYFFSEENILQVLREKYRLYPMERDPSATAKYWITDQLKKVGIISNMSDSFCGDCNRLRLDSFGRIYGCLSSTRAIPVMNDLHDADKLTEKLKMALEEKKLSFTGSSTSMKYIGG